MIGSLAAGGTLGILIPPSISLILYGVLAEESIGRLYMAGLFPGILLSLSFMAMIAVMAIFWRGMAPREEEESFRNWEGWKLQTDRSRSTAARGGPDFPRAGLHLFGLGCSQRSGGLWRNRSLLS